MRPLYDRTASSIGKKDICAALEKAHGVKFHETPPGYCVEFFVTKDGNGIGWYDVADHPDFPYMTYAISAARLAWIQSIVAGTGLSYTIVARLAGKLMYYKHTHPDWVMSLAQRTASVAGDIEPAAFIELRKFKPIKL